MKVDISEVIMTVAEQLNIDKSGIEGLLIFMV